ncbi:hypothetical protein [Piscinibacter sp.]|uniref:hypothetical protein n=1 Tax=Piscinibacter sp. TaxID=1903157 RepID=UPI0039E2D5E8
MKHAIASALLALACGAALAQGAKKPAAPAAAASAPAAAAPVQDSAAIDRQQIIGNRELPKVLYIVPWKKPLPGDLAGRPGGGVLDEALAPVDRDVFRRQVQYDAQIAPK